MRKTAVNLCIRSGEFLQALPVAIMRPQDLIGFGRLNYGEAGTVRSFAKADWVDAGLNECEKEIFDKLPPGHKRILVLGVGGGREALSFAKDGHRVTGVDFVPAMIDSLYENARRWGVEIDGAVQEISLVDMPASAFDLVWLCTNMYSVVPTRKKRIGMARAIAAALKPAGFFACHFFMDPDKGNSRFSFFAKKAIALSTFGNISLEHGDMLWRNREFLHAFSSIREVEAELAAAGFVLHAALPGAGQNCAAIFIKKKER
jgi:SAM-dependent methyltransferase